jgi:hypothetical protein
MTTKLSQLESRRKEFTQEKWLEYCDKELKLISRNQLGDVLRDISIECRDSASISEDRKSDLLALRSLALEHELSLENSIQVEKINELKIKIDNAPKDSLLKFQKRLATIEGQRLSYQSAIFSSPQEKILATELQTKSIKELELDLELNRDIRKNQAVADILDKEQERTSRKWISLANKDLVAALVGGFLLIIITVALISTLFITNINSAGLEILKSGFMVLLGFFFGQGLKSQESKSSNNN